MNRKIVGIVTSPRLVIPGIVTSLFNDGQAHFVLVGDATSVGVELYVSPLAKEVLDKVPDWDVSYQPESGTNYHKAVLHRTIMQVIFDLMRSEFVLDLQFRQQKLEVEDT